jgi:hypothetical protein
MEELEACGVPMLAIAAYLRNANRVHRERHGVATGALASSCSEHQPGVSGRNRAVSPDAHVPSCGALLRGKWFAGGNEDLQQ